MNRFELWVNDRPVEVRDEPPTRTLLDFLREREGLTGTKEGCAEGDCGACTVAVLDPDAPGGPRFRAINSCLLLLPMLRGKRVYTVEALASGKELHPAQQALVDHFGSQCGFCTPGIVMSMFEATYRSDLDGEDREARLEDQLAGNICRCTGYRPIREAANEVAGSRPNDRFLRMLEEAERPSTTRDCEEPRGAYEVESGKFYAPSTFDALFEILSGHPEAKIVCGGTDIGLLVTKQHRKLPCLVSLERLPGLKRIEKTRSSLIFGGSLPLTDLEQAARETLPPVCRMLRFFASRQIKHRATIGGNICNASPIGDLAPVLLALGAICHLRGEAGSRRVPMAELFLDYRKTALEGQEILEAVEVPLIPDDARASAYKVSKRRELDISSVSAAFFVRTSPSEEVTEARLAYGGMAATPARARGAEKALLGKKWTDEAIEAAVEALKNDFNPIDDLRASAWYRGVVAANLLRGFFAETKETRIPRLSLRPSGTVEPPPSSKAAASSDAASRSPQGRPNRGPMRSNEGKGEER